MRAVISQSMYFPWVGMLEQFRLADIFIHYDDVQYSRGFFNRVQIKTASGVRWMTVPLRKHRQGQSIQEILPDDRFDWQSQHRQLLAEAYRESPFRDDMLDVYAAAILRGGATLADVSRGSMLTLVDYFGLRQDKILMNSAEAGIGGKSTERLLALCQNVNADVYLTGHGAQHYLDHKLFENNGVRVEYMDYQRLPYPQRHGEFTPYVSALDLIANCGPDGWKFICSGSVYWKEFIDEPK